MDETISAANANRRFWDVLRRLQNGRSVVVTSHGRPVAKISPVAGDDRAIVLPVQTLGELFSVLVRPFCSSFSTACTDELA